ncbi:glycosyltransferase [Campylobacter lari]|nr:glycosyltransferase [Campylobacter lari]
MILNSKKLRKLRTNPKLFFKDAIEKKTFWLSGVYNKYLPKKYKGFAQYTIVSAVYNVEKYLDDYFNSIINQRLDFKKNIFMILVDDGSTDDSANIIKKYQKKYPKNIVYLYKENGGQASARNLGLKYMQENNYKTPWVTFTDPDDFLDRNYFYEVDKFLSTHHQDDNICMIGCNRKIFFEYDKKIQNNFSYCYKFNKGTKKIQLKELTLEFETPAAMLFLFNVLKQEQIYFDERLHIYEDVKFSLNYMACLNSESNISFIEESIYYTRKRLDQSSTMNNAKYKRTYYIDCLYYGIFETLIQKERSNYVKNCALFHIIPQMRILLNEPFLLIGDDRKKYLELLKRFFSFYSQDHILRFSEVGNNFMLKTGILNLFKNINCKYKIFNILEYDAEKESILLSYFTGDCEEEVIFYIDNQEIFPDYSKQITHLFLDELFVYERRFWIHIPHDAKKNLEGFVNNDRSMFISWNKFSHSVAEIRKKFISNQENIWLFGDRDIEADDNAEHLYRYVMHHHPKQKIVFVLKKNSLDWKRLENEGFNLIEPYTELFYKVAARSKCLIFSNSYGAFDYVPRENQKFIFLAHGVNCNDISKYFNNLKIHLLITSIKKEYDYIVFGEKYFLSKKNVVLTGMPRHDNLFNNRNRNRNRNIIIMPTWRLYLVESLQKNTNERQLKDLFFESEYYLKWCSLLRSEKLKEIVLKYGYNITYVAHFNMKELLDKIEIPKYIKILYRNSGESFQNNFINSNLMITDYSSAAFEMAFMNKPTIYYQFDKEYFFNNHGYKQGWFRHIYDGFGPCVENEEQLLLELEKILASNCNVESQYLKNMDCFAFKDKNACKRVYDAIVDMLDEYEYKINIDEIRERALIAQHSHKINIAYYRWLHLIQNCAKPLESDYYNFLYCRNILDVSDSIFEIVEQDSGFKILLSKSNRMKIELLKFYVKTKNKCKINDILNSIKYKNEYKKDFLILKLKIFAYIDDMLQFNYTKKKLVEEFNFNLEDIGLILFAIQKSLIEKDNFLEFDYEKLL